jgi:hypothetical protein
MTSARTTQTSESIEGLVERVGSYGFTLDGRDGWISISKFADPRPELPAEGARVRVDLDRSGYARAIEVLEAAPFTAEPSRGESGNTSYLDRDTRIMRQAVLNTAVALLSSGGREVSLEDVIDTAETLEQWVTR